jgi:hypothetical protein
VERRKRNKARLATRQMQGLCKNEWMAATATDSTCADGPRESVNQRLSLKGPPLPLPLRYALDPHPAAPQCQSANHVSHPAPVHAANSWSTNGAALVVHMRALQLHQQWLSRNLCHTFCPASPPVSFSSRLAHCDSSMAAIFGAPSTEILHRRALHALQQLSPQSDLYSHLILECLTVFVFPTLHLVVLSTAVAGQPDCVPTPPEFCFAPWLTGTAAAEYE